MRVKCDKCGAAFAVDEKRIPEKGARAQCPKCKAVQIVRRPADGQAAHLEPPKPAVPAPSPTSAQLSSLFGAPPQPAAGASPLSDLFGSAPAPAAAAPAPLSDLFGSAPAPAPAAPAPLSDLFGSAPAPAPAAPAPLSELFGGAPAGAELAGKAPLSDLFGPPAPAAPSAPASALDLFGAPGSGAQTAASPFAGPPPREAFGSPGASSSPVASDLFGGSAADPFADLGGPATPASPALPCRVCSTPLSDPLDAALGICPKCRARSEGHAQTSEPAKVPVVMFGGAAAAPSPEPKPAPKASPAADFLDAPPANLGGGELDLGSSGSGSLELDNAPLELDRPEPAKPQPRPAPKPASASPAAKPQPSRPAASAAATGVAAAMANPANAAFLPMPKVAPVRKSRAPKIAAVGLVVLALGGGAAWVVMKKPGLVGRQEEKKKSIYLPEIEQRLVAWKLALPGLKGTSDEHFKRGVELFLEDRYTSYIEAQEEMKAAVVLDPNNFDAVVRYVDAFAVGQADRASAERIAEARELIGAILAKRPKMASAHWARANLLLATGQDDLARAEAEEALGLASPEEKPEVLLAWGRTYLKKSAPIAQEKFEAALQQAPALKRALYYRGLAAEHAGNFAKALTAYQERLRIDPDHRDSLRALARVQARVGDHKAARAALRAYIEKHPTIGEPRIMQAQFVFATERDLKATEKELRALGAELEDFDDTEKLQYFLLSSALSRERGDAAGALAQAGKALEIAPSSGAAHFQAMLAALASKQAEKARGHLSACEQEMGDLGRFQEYMGRIELAAGQLDGAIAAFRRAAELAPTRVAPRLCGAAVLVRRGDELGAWAMLRPALELDSGSVARLRRPLSDFFEPEIESVRPAAGVFKSKPGDEEGWLADIYGAIVDYHLGELDGPARALDKALVIDSTSLPALIYRAQIELDRGKLDKALVFARRASQADTQSAVANYLIGRALDAMGKTEGARAAYIKALEQNPRLTEANVRLAELLAKVGNKDEAKDRLLQVVSDDADNLEARVALFNLGY